MGGYEVERKGRRQDDVCVHAYCCACCSAYT